VTPGTWPKPKPPSSRRSSPRKPRCNGSGRRCTAPDVPHIPVLGATRCGALRHGDEMIRCVAEKVKSRVGPCQFFFGFGK